MLPWCAWSETTVGVEPTGYTSSSTAFSITEAGNLVWLADQVNNQSNYFSGVTITLENDLDMDGVSFTPIGNASSKSFCGTFDGNGNTIKKLTVNKSSSYVGLFGHVGVGGIVKDLTLDANCSFESNKSIIGSIAGKNEGSILNCSNCGTVNAGSSGYNCGGIVGSNYGLVSGCTNMSNVSAKNQVGGIAGSQLDNGKISYCSNRKCW